MVAQDPFCLSVATRHVLLQGVPEKEFTAKYNNGYKEWLEDLAQGHATPVTIRTAS